MVMAPRMEASILERVNFVRLRDNQVLAVFVASKGAMQNRIVDTERDHSQDELDRMARYLNESLEGRTLDEARLWIETQLREERANYDRFMHDALVLGEAISITSGVPSCTSKAACRRSNSPSFPIATRCANCCARLTTRPRCWNCSKAASRTPGLWCRSARRTTTAAVVAERGGSIVRGGSSTLGSLAIVGPVRMDYERVIPLVEYTARALSRLMEY